MAATIDWSRSLPISEVDRIIQNTLHEDLAGGDLSAQCCVEATATAVATATAKEDLVVCGGDVWKRVFEIVDSTIEVETLVADGVKVTKGTVVWKVKGNARTILAGERTALNLTQRMSGIATMASTYAAALTPGSTTRVTDTRKTMPGLRILDRYSVRVGGCHNHRDNLGSAVMAKDNHIVAAGGVTQAVKRAKAMAPHTCKIQVEVESYEMLEEAMDAGADIIMLDNMNDAEVEESLRRVSLRQIKPIIEASGGITLGRVGSLSKLGVDVISVGALTHSVKNSDISLKFQFDK